MLFELNAAPGVEVSELRATLDLDAGYLSRILTRFAADGLVVRETSTVDARRQVARLTPAGSAAFTDLDAAQVRAVEAMLEPLQASERDLLTGAMETVRRALGHDPAPATYVLRAPEPGDLGWVVSRHGALYAAEYGWDPTFETLVARIVGEYDPAAGAAWIADLDGKPVGCVFCVGDDDTTARLRLLLVDPAARGTGLGRRLVEECLRYARRAGYARITLWTNDVLTAARRIYLDAGFTLDREEPHHRFGRDLVGQHWSRDL